MRFFVAIVVFCAFCFTAWGVHYEDVGMLASDGRVFCEEADALADRQLGGTTAVLGNPAEYTLPQARSGSDSRVSGDFSQSNQDKNHEKKIKGSGRGSGKRKKSGRLAALLGCTRGEVSPTMSRAALAREHHVPMLTSPSPVTPVVSVPAENTIVRGVSMSQAHREFPSSATLSHVTVRNDVTAPLPDYEPVGQVGTKAASAGPKDYAGLRRSMLDPVGDYDVIPTRLSYRASFGDKDALAASPPSDSGYLRDSFAPAGSKPISFSPPESVFPLSTSFSSENSGDGQSVSLERARSLASSPGSFAGGRRQALPEGGKAAPPLPPRPAGSLPNSLSGSFQRETGLFGPPLPPRNRTIEHTSSLKLEKNSASGSTSTSTSTSTPSSNNSLGLFAQGGTTVGRAQDAVVQVNGTGVTKGFHVKASVSPGAQENFLMQDVNAMGRRDDIVQILSESALPMFCSSEWFSDYLGETVSDKTEGYTVCYTRVVRQNIFREMQGLICARLIADGVVYEEDFKRVLFVVRAVSALESIQAVFKNMKANNASLESFPEVRVCTHGVSFGPERTCEHEIVYFIHECIKSGEGAANDLKNVVRFSRNLQQVYMLSMFSVEPVASQTLTVRLRDFGMGRSAQADVPPSASVFEKISPLGGRLMEACRSKKRILSIGAWSGCQVSRRGDKEVWLAPEWGVGLAYQQSLLKLIACKLTQSMANVVDRLKSVEGIIIPIFSFHGKGGIDIFGLENRQAVYEMRDYICAHLNEIDEEHCITPGFQVLGLYTIWAVLENLFDGNSVSDAVFQIQAKCIQNTSGRHRRNFHSNFVLPQVDPFESERSSMLNSEGSRGVVPGRTMVLLLPIPQEEVKVNKHLYGWLPQAYEKADSLLRGYGYLVENFGADYFQRELSGGTGFSYEEDCGEKRVHVFPRVYVGEQQHRLCGHVNVSKNTKMSFVKRSS